MLLPEPDGPTMPTIWPAGTLKCHVVQHFRPVDPITEGDVLESDVAADLRQRGAPRIVDRLRRGVEDVAEALDRQPRLVEILPDLRQAQHRCADPAGQHVEGDEFADAQVAVDH